MRASRGFLGFSRSVWLRLPAPVLAVGLSGCTLITDVDREKIPEPQAPTFTEVDAGRQPPAQLSDAGTPDASLAPDQPPDAGADAGSDVADAGDAGPDPDAG